MAGMRVISADSHMMEPADLWEIRLDHKFSDRAPKVVKNERGKGFHVCRAGCAAVSGGGRLSASARAARNSRNICRRVTKRRGPADGIRPSD